jgi:hypothetical protein
VKSEESVAIFNIKGRKRNREGLLLHTAAKAPKGKKKKKIEAQFCNEQVRAIFMFGSSEDKS